MLVLTIATCACALPPADQDRGDGALYFDMARAYADAMLEVGRDRYGERHGPAFVDTIDPAELTWFVTGDLEKIEAGIAELELGSMEVWDADGNRLR